MFLCGVKNKNMTNIIIEDGSPQAKKFVAYAYKSAVVKSYLPALFSYVVKNPYTHFVYPKLFQHKQDIQNTHLNDWTETADKQLIMFNSTQSAKQRICNNYKGAHFVLSIPTNVKKQYKIRTPKDNINN